MPMVVPARLCMARRGVAAPQAAVSSCERHRLRRLRLRLCTLRRGGPFVPGGVTWVAGAFVACELVLDTAAALASGGSACGAPIMRDTIEDNPAGFRGLPGMQCLGRRLGLCAPGDVTAA
jgi:hypothetical protein